MRRRNERGVAQRTRKVTSEFLPQRAHRSCASADIGRGQKRAAAEQTELPAPVRAVGPLLQFLVLSHRQLYDAVKDTKKLLKSLLMRSIVGVAAGAAAARLGARAMPRASARARWRRDMRFSLWARTVRWTSSTARREASGGAQGAAEGTAAEHRRERVVLPHRFTADEHLAHDPLRAVDQLVVLEEVAVDVLAGVVAVPVAQALRIDEGDICLRTDIQGADVEAEEFRRLPRQPAHHAAHGLGAVLLGELQGHEVAVEEGHVGDVRAGVVEARQRALVQQVIAKLTEVSFDTCLQKKPDSTLSAGERACIHTVVGKYLDTSEFVLGRSTKKAQQSQMLS